MDWKQRLQEDLQEALRAQDDVRVNVIRTLVAALEKAQEELGKEAFDNSNPQEADIPPDREQSLSRGRIQEIVRTELEQRRETVEDFRAQKRTEQADAEESGIAVLERYLEEL